MAAHSGNTLFRKIIQSMKPTYVAAARKEKIEIAQQVITDLQSRTPPGRFLEKTYDGNYMIISERRALEKSKYNLKVGIGNI